MRADTGASGADAEAGSPDSAASTFLTFDLAGQTLGIAVRSVREILDLQPLCRMPGGASDTCGLIDVRGSSVPVIDLAERLGLGSCEQGPENRIVVFEVMVDDQPRPLGVVAERVRDVCRIEPDAIEPVPALGKGGRTPLLGLCRRHDTLVSLIELDRVFRSAELELGHA